MDLRPSCRTSLFVNKLPEMFSCWQEYYDFWQPWVIANRQFQLTHTQFENSGVNVYQIDWCHVKKMCGKQPKYKLKKLAKPSKLLVMRWLKSFWQNLALN